MSDDVMSWVHEELRREKKIWLSDWNALPGRRRPTGLTLIRPAVTFYNNIINKWLFIVHDVFYEPFIKKL